MSTPEKASIGLPFNLYNYDHFGIAGEVNELIELGHLPSDTFFRLAAVGQQTDPEDTRSQYLLSYNLMVDMVEHFDSPDKMRTETQEVLWGTLPDAIIDVNSRINYHLMVCSIRCIIE